MTGAAATDLYFSDLPWWRGVTTTHGVAQSFPLQLGWDGRGFVRQVSNAEVRRKIRTAYAADDYAFMTPPPGSSTWANQLGNAKIASVEALTGNRSNLRVLEIGAGSLYIARRLSRSHRIAHYVVVDPSIKEPAGAGLTVVRDYYPTDALGLERFDLVLSFNCLEHVDDPVAFLRAIRGALAGGDSRILLTFPNVARQFAAGDMNAIVHEHMSYMDAAAVDAVLALAGLERLSLTSDNDCFTCLAGPARPVVRPPRRAPGALVSAAGQFRERVERAMDTVAADLGHGRTVAFHGATNGLNSILYFAGLGSAEKLLLFDSDESKRGRYLPACTQPIRSITDPAYRDADTIYVSATSFYAEICRTITGAHCIDPARIRPLFGGA